MNILGDIQSILNRKGSEVWSVPPDWVVFDAIRLMADKNVGALPVVEGGVLIGILSERDYTRKVVLKGKTSKEAQVREIMLSPVISVSPKHTVEECMRIMTEHRIRHLPVLEEKKIIGLVSIGDLVNWIINAQQETINHLENYISGRYPG